MANYPEEIFYHIFQRSFYDSDGDKHGDFQGLESKLSYLKDLGITSIILVPLYESPYYHNYFADDFRKIDPLYGTQESFFSLVEKVHELGMRIYLDMEIHYITENHKWFQSAYGNPDSEYSNYILFNDQEQVIPETVIFNLDSLESYNGEKYKLATLNLNSNEVKSYIFNEFRYWIDPLNNGSLKYGVDGFRIDHMMDNLDNKGRLNNLFEGFWKPMFTELREINPKVRFMGEQGDWTSYGYEFFKQADIDYMFAFPLKFAISDFDKQKIIEQCLLLKENTPEGKRQIVFIENHDMDRFSSVVEGDLRKLKIGASLNLLISGLPSIYYGQELGMKGKGGFNAYGISDGNDIPRREAFPWTAKIETEGNALWYKETGPWWEDSELSDHSGISVEEQIDNPESLLNFYRDLIKIRRENSAFGDGELRFLDIENENILGFERKKEDHSMLVLLNLSEANTAFFINEIDFKDKYTEVYRANSSQLDTGSLGPYEIRILRYKK